MEAIPLTTFERAAPFVLTVEDGLLSLRAQEASLKAIVEALGRQLDIEVVARVSPEEHVTKTFDRLSLEETLNRIRAYAKIVYLIKGSDKASGQVSKILFFPKHAATSTSGHPSHAVDSREVAPAGMSDRRVQDEGSREESRRPGPFTLQIDLSR